MRDIWRNILNLVVGPSWMKFSSSNFKFQARFDRNVCKAREMSTLSANCFLLILFNSRIYVAILINLFWYLYNIYMLLWVPFIQIRQLLYTHILAISSSYCMDGSWDNFWSKRLRCMGICRDNMGVIFC